MREERDFSFLFPFRCLVSAFFSVFSPLRFSDLIPGFAADLAFFAFFLISSLFEIKKPIFLLDLSLFGFSELEFLFFFETVVSLSIVCFKAPYSRLLPSKVFIHPSSFLTFYMKP